MRDFNRLDVGSFRGFYFAAEALSFTAAAQKAGMTQSGVSQHISKLESQLGVSLFLRVGKRVILTDAGRKLKQHVEQYLDQQERFAESVSTAQTSLKGRVSYAMPASCLMTPHFQILLKERDKRFAELELGVTLCPSDEVIERLLRGEIDFGFVTKKLPHSEIRYTPFCPEEYVLVSGAPLGELDPARLRELPWIAHPGVDVLFCFWLKHHFPRATKSLPWSSLRVVGEMNSLQGAIHMVEAGMGMTVIPRHCVDALLEKRRLFPFRDATRGAARNMIYIVSLSEARLPRRVETVMDVFLGMRERDGH